MKKFKNITLTLLLTLLLACTACSKNDTADKASSDTSNVESSEAVEDNDNTDSEDADLAKDFLSKFADIEKQSEELKNSIENDDLSQTDYNLKSGDLYTLWDDCLNELWGVLGKTLSSDEMDKLTEEEQTWIADKDKQVEEAGKEVEGGSMQPMVESMKGAELTEKRVRELIKLLTGENEYSSLEKAEETEPSNESKSDKTVDSKSDLFDSFLAGDTEAVISDKLKNSCVMFDIALNAGDSFDIKTIDSINTLCEPISGRKSNISYTSFENPNRKAYALAYKYDVEATSFTIFYVISENDGKLQVDFVIDAWERRYPTFNKYGVVFDQGSNGAGAHSNIVIVPTSDFEYKTLYEEEDNAAGWNFYEPGTDDEVKTISDIMNAALDSGREDISDIIYTQLKVNGSTYYYYLKDDITQDMVDYIDSLTEEYNFEFDGKDKADEEIEKYAKELSADGFYNNEDFAEWKDL